MIVFWEKYLGASTFMNLCFAIDTELLSISVLLTYCALFALVHRVESRSKTKPPFKTNLNTTPDPSAIFRIRKKIKILVDSYSFQYDTQTHFL